MASSNESAFSILRSNGPFPDSDIDEVVYGAVEDFSSAENVVATLNSTLRDSDTKADVHHYIVPYFHRVPYAGTTDLRLRMDNSIQFTSDEPGSYSDSTCKGRIESLVEENRQLRLRLAMIASTENAVDELTRESSTCTIRENSAIVKYTLICPTVRSAKMKISAVDDLR